MTFKEEFEEVVRLWVESPEFAEEAHEEFLAKLEGIDHIMVKRRDAEMALLGLDFWLKDMYSKGVEGGIDEPWCAHDAIARALGQEEWSPEERYFRE